MKRGTRGMGRVYERGGVWWIAYYHDWKKIRESSRSAKRSEAVALLKKRHEEIGKGRPACEAEKVPLADLRALIDADYQLNSRRSGRRLGLSWSHVEAFFGEREKAVNVTASRLAAYVMARSKDSAAPNTIRNELGALKRAFNLARKAGALLPNETPAAWPTVSPGAPRSGFFEREEHDAVKAALAPDVADVAEFLFWSGWRKGEALALRWPHVDERVQVIRIDATKNGEPRTLPYGALPQLVELLERRRRISDEIQKKRGMVVSHVFHRNGERITTFYRSWAAACVAAGLGREERAPDVVDAGGEVLRKGRLLRRVITRIPHDYRRSAARNLSRAGVPERVIMQLCGWKTRSVFDRYRIVNETDLSEGLARLAAAAPTAGPAPKVAVFKNRRK